MIEQTFKNIDDVLWKEKGCNSGLNVEHRVSELDNAKLSDLLELRYHSINDAVATLGSVNEIRELFVGFPKHLYASAASSP